MNFPKHEASLRLVHNEHKDYYWTVQESIENNRFGYELEDWVSPEEMMKAINTNECWYIQWYPVTPIGFELKSASSLEALLDYFNVS